MYHYGLANQYRRMYISLIETADHLNLDQTAIADDKFLGPENNNEVAQNLDAIIADAVFPEPSSNLDDDNEGSSTIMNSTGKGIIGKPRVSII